MIHMFNVCSIGQYKLPLCPWYGSGPIMCNPTFSKMQEEKEFDNKTGIGQRCDNMIFQSASQIKTNKSFV